MNRSRHLLLITGVLLVTAGCAEPKPKAKASRAPSTSTGQFEGIGSVTLHQGQPCTPQIMFDFHAGFGETVELAADFKDSRILTDAARRHSRIRVFGAWRRAHDTGCRFIDVTGVQK